MERLTLSLPLLELQVPLMQPLPSPWPLLLALVAFPDLVSLAPPKTADQRRQLSCSPCHMCWVAVQQVLLLGPGLCPPDSMGFSLVFVPFLSLAANPAVIVTRSYPAMELG